MMKRDGITKKAISNIEMSLAIILFVSAVFSIILIFNLYHKPDKIDSSVLDNFEQNFLNYADNFTKVGVYAGSGTCINVSLNSNLNTCTVFFNNSQVSSRLDGDYLIFEGKSGDYYEVYDLSSVEKPYTGNCLKSEENYTTPVRGKIFSNNILKLISSSFSNINFVVKDENEQIIFSSNKIPPKGAEVLSKTFFILVYDDYKIKNCYVRVQIW